jgi:DNA-binding NarL/FixJ family response regulator
VIVQLLEREASLAALAGYAALALHDTTDEAALRQALKLFAGLGASAAAQLTRHKMRTLRMTAIPRGPRPATRAAPAGLTAREQEVLALLAEGLPDKEISRRLFISERTVHHHVSALLSKIGFSSRTAAVRVAARLGIAPDRAPDRGPALTVAGRRPAI